jgi:hypothetical protein
MAYVPLAPTMFFAAYSGAIAGMTAGGRNLVDNVVGDYAGFAAVAQAWAQSFDTVWGAVAATSADVTMAEDLSEMTWEQREPGQAGTSILPSNWTALVTNVIAVILAVKANFTANGETPPAPSGATPAGIGYWKNTAAGVLDANADFTVVGGIWTADVVVGASPFTPTAAQRYVAVDTTAGAVNILTPLNTDGVSLPFDGQKFFIKARKASATPIRVTANGAGVTTEDPSNGGTYGATGSIQAVAGSCVGFCHRAADKLWIAFSGV